MGRKLAALALVPLAALAAALLLARVPALESFPLKAGDLQRRHFAEPARADRRIVLVEIDQRSIDHFERDAIGWPWPRSLYNPLLEYCARSGAKAVLFDVLFNDLSPYGEEVDAEFAAALRASGRAWLGASFSEAARGEGLAERFSLPVAGRAPPALVRGAAAAPLPALREAAAGLGSVSQRPDADGVFRRVPPGVVFRGRFVPGLAFAPLAGAAGEARFGDGRVRLGGLEAPLDRDGMMLVRFRGPRAVHRRYTAAEIIASGIAAAAGEKPTVPPEALRGAYVLVGASAPGLLDLKPTPLSASEPAFGVHAAALDNLLNRDFLAAAPPAASAALALALALALAAAVIFLPVAGAALALPLAGAALFGTLFAAYRAGWLLDLWTAGSTAILAVVGAAVWRYQTEGKQRRFIASAFSRYVSPKVVSQILADPGRLALGGERRELTLFFSDLQGFTTISEGMSPQELVAFINEYTTLMAGVVYEFDGTIDKYIGDSVMAFWGAPVPQPDHARRALLAALTCQERLVPFVERLMAAGKPRLVTRIGLNSGECVVGNMGSHDRFDYTALGDTVNQASRLEGINKAYGTLICVSETTWAAAGEVAFGRLLDRVRVKGKAQPVAIYEAMAKAGAETERMRTVRTRWDEAFAAYQAGEWARASEIAEEILRGGEDGPAKTLRERCRAFIAEPPAAWDGVWTFQSK